MKKTKQFIGLLLVLIMLMSFCSVAQVGATEAQKVEMELTLGNYEVYIPVSWTEVPEASKYVFSVVGKGCSRNIETTETKLEWHPDYYYCDKALLQVKAYDSVDRQIGESLIYVYSIGFACVDWAGMYGDVDYDDKVTIKDATQIQKYIAGMVYFNVPQRWCASVDKDVEINIKDVTAIQKHLADIELESYIGKEYFGGREVYYAEKKGIYSE